ncbi:MAG: sialate O-acetylesterase [Phycisphaera sp.]|nr:sialate O-acetylesterase [Phycisphaera sp.]
MIRITIDVRAVLIAAVVFLCGASGALAEVRPARIFANHMVLQCDRPVPVWGHADAGAAVTVAFSGQTVETKADAAGRWRVDLKPLRASVVRQQMTVRSGDDRVVFDDVLVGEVWLADGQSNMEYRVAQMAKALPEGQAMADMADLPAVRYRKIHDRDAPQPVDDLKDAQDWVVCTPQTVGNCSAVAFVFARRVHLTLGVPVGIIDCSWGGTPIEPHIPIEAFTGHPTLEKLAALAKANDIDGIKALPGGTYVRGSNWLPATIYNGRVAPVKPYAIRGGIWYQAESNCGHGEDPRDYEQKMRALIRGWRSVFEQPDLPVYFVQLPQWNSYAWTYAREEQRRAMAVPNTGMAVTIDLDNANNIHPPNKIDVGERLACWPLAQVYGKTMEVSGPLFRNAKAKDGAMVVTFDHVTHGLLIGGIEGVGKIVAATGDDAVLHGFELAGADGVWHDAQATIEGEAVVVRSAEVKQPAAVRYACAPQAAKDKPWNLYNGAGMPASPFCSDWSLMPYDPAKNPMK